MKRREWLQWLLALTATSNSTAREVQSHGLRFEHWLCDTFFSGYRPTSYTQKWDIPADVNTAHGNIPANPKAIQFGSSIGLGDALRQFQIIEDGQPFLLIIGFWDQADTITKKWVNVQAVTIRPEDWARLWAPLQRTDIERLDAIIKDPALSLDEAREQVAALKAEPPFSETLITLNPKLDRSQRRLQCSLRFTTFFEVFAPGASREPQAEPTLWGIPVPPLDDAEARSFEPAAD